MMRNRIVAHLPGLHFPGLSASLGLLTASTVVVGIPSHSTKSYSYRSLSWELGLHLSIRIINRIDEFLKCGLGSSQILRLNRRRKIERSGYFVRFHLISI